MTHPHFHFPVFLSTAYPWGTLYSHHDPQNWGGGIVGFFSSLSDTTLQQSKRWLCCFSLQPPYKEDLEIKFLGKGLSKIQSILSKISYPCKPSLSSSTWEHPSCCFFLPLGQFLPSLGTSSTLPKIEGSSYFPHFVFSPCVIILVPQKASPITGGKGEKGEQSMLQGNLHAN